MSVIFTGIEETGRRIEANHWKILNPSYLYIHDWVKPHQIDDVMSEALKEIIVMNSWSKIIFDGSFIISSYVWSQAFGTPPIINLGYVLELVDLINRKGHTVKLYCYDSHTDLPIGNAEGIELFDKLNDVYIDVVKNKCSIEKLIVENISDRR